MNPHITRMLTFRSVRVVQETFVSVIDGLIQNNCLVLLKALQPDTVSRTAITNCVAQFHKQGLFLDAMRS